jgi:hypothetical protein
MGLTDINTFFTKIDQGKEEGKKAGTELTCYWLLARVAAPVAQMMGVQALETKMWNEIERR